MLPEAGATELLFLAAVALIVVGPKDLPVLMRKVGQWVGKMRALAAEFRSSFDELARQSELDELRKEVEALRNMRDPVPAASSTFNEINASLDPHAYQADNTTFHEAVGLADIDPHAGVERSYPAVTPEDLATPEGEKAVAKPRRKAAAKAEGGTAGAAKRKARKAAAAATAAPELVSEESTARKALARKRRAKSAAETEA